MRSPLHTAPATLGLPTHLRRREEQTSSPQEDVSLKNIRPRKISDHEPGSNGVPEAAREKVELDLGFSPGKSPPPAGPNFPLKSEGGSWTPTH